MKITIQQADQYGATIYRPICETSKTFALIAKTKTLTPETLRAIKSLGYQLEIIHPQPLTI